MNWTIYSTGDGAFLTEILNGVGMMTGSGNIAALAGIGFLIGVVFTVIQAVVGGGQKLGFGGILVAAVLYLAMFTPRVTVTVFDTYTWTGRQVSNVPLGVAATGHILSHVGYGITEMLEQAYSIPGMLDTGYATPLEMLLSVRNNGLGPANHIGDNDNFLQTMANYSKDCTEVGFNLGFLDPAQVVTQPNVWQAMEFQSNLYTTKVRLPGGPPDGETVTCNQAYAQISNQWGARLDAWNAVLSNRYGVGDARTVMQGALNSMVEVGLSANDYMKNAFAMNVLRRVDRGDYSPGMYAATLINAQASEQARVQFAGEASLWARFARPLMTFVEGFVYSLTPFMAFVIGFGMMGISLIGRYLMILLWVQLWMPILSVVNLFIDLSFSHKMDALNSTLLYDGSPLSALSMLGMSNMQNLAADWIAVGGNLVAAAPALSLAIVYGGAYSLVNMAHRLSPQDMIDEKQAAPDLMKNAGVMSLSPQMQQDVTAGMRMTGADAAMGNATIGTAVTQGVSSARNEMESSQQAYSQALTQGISTAFSHGNTAKLAQTMGKNVSTNESTDFGRTIGRAEKYAQAHGFNQDQTNMLKGAVAISASIGAGFEVFGTGFKSALQGSSTGTDDLKESTSFNQDFSNMLDEASSESVRKSFQKTASAAANNSVDEGWEQIAREQGGENYTNSLQRMKQASRSFQEAQSLSRSVGTNQGIPITTLAERMSQNRDTMSYIGGHLGRDTELARRVDNRMEAMERIGPDGLFGDARVQANEEKYRAAAYFQETAASAFDRGLNPGIQHLREQGLNLSLKNSGYVAEGSLQEGVDPRANEGIADNTEQRATAATAEAKVKTGQAARQVADSGVSADSVEFGMKRVSDNVGTTKDFGSRRSAWEQEARQSTGLTGVAGSAAVDNAYRNLENAPAPSTTAGWYGMIESASAALGQDVTEAFRNEDGSKMSKEEVADRALAVGNPGMWFASKVVGHFFDSDHGPSAEEIQQKMAAGSSRVYDNLYSRGLSIGLTETQAEAYGYAGSIAYRGEMERMMGGSASFTEMAKTAAEGGVSTDDSYHQRLYEHSYEAIRSEYLERFNGDEAKADQWANATFDSIYKAGVAGSYGSEYLTRLSAADATLGMDKGN